MNLRRLVGYRKDCHGTIANVSAIAPGMEAAETEKLNHTRLGQHPGRVSAVVAIVKTPHALQFLRQRKRPQLRYVWYQNYGLSLAESEGFEPSIRY